MGQINAQSLFNRVRMWMAGLQFHGKRDLYEVFGYKRDLQHQDYISIYYRQGVAKRVIDAPVLGLWADPPQLVADNQEFNDAWEKLISDQGLFNKVMRLDKLTGLGRFAVMVCGFDDGGKLDTPVRPGKAREVLYLQPYHEGAISISLWDSDSSSPRFGQPVMYNINPGRMLLDGSHATIGQGGNALELRRPFNCHYTRLIHVAENLLEDQTFGNSRLEVIYNDISDILKVTGSSAETFWLIANRGLQIDVDKDTDLTPEDAKDLAQEVEDYQHQLRRFIRTRGVKIQDLGSNGVDPMNVFKVLIMLISMGTGIPQLVLVGSAAGQVSSRNDRANWADRLAERVAEYGEPIVLKRLMDCFINAGVLPIPVNLQINWPEAFKLDPLERAQTSAQMARSAVNLIRGAVHASPVDENGQPIHDGPLFSNEEMRQMVSFGRHPPVFDMPLASGDVPPAGSPEAQPSSTSDAGADPPKPTATGGSGAKGSGSGSGSGGKPGVPGPAKTKSKPLGVKR